MDFTKLLTKALPFIGAAATGNVPALVALAAREVGDVLGMKIDETPEAISTAVANATPEQLVALRSREMEFKERMAALGFKNEQDVRQIALDETKVYVADTDAARKAHADDRGVYWLGICVLLTFAGVMGLALYGSYKLLMDDSLRHVNPGVLAAVFGFLGTAVGYVAANAQQVVSYFFGSSRGSTDKSRDMAEAIKNFGSAK